MVLLRFKNENQIDKIIEMLDFVRGFVVGKKTPSEEMNKMIKSIEEIKPYQKIFPYLVVRPDEIDILLGNAIWILGQVLKTSKLDENTELQYRNSIKLMKELKEIILTKRCKGKPTIDRNREFYPELENFYKNNLNKTFVISNQIEEIENVRNPKIGEEWVLLTYVEADPNKKEEYPEEDSLIISNSGDLFTLPTSLFKEIAYLK